MQRLFSTFPNGWPGAGLLLLRLAAGLPLMFDGVFTIRGSPSFGLILLAAAGAAGGVFILLGLWTPVLGLAELFLESWKVVTRTGDSSWHIHMAALALTLVMLGPGAWSIDAHLFGRRRINL